MEWFAAEFPPSGWVEMMRFALKSGGKRLEHWSREFLDEPGELADWAYCMQPYRPALSILVTRASFSADIAGFEWVGRLANISETRSRLGLDDQDAFHTLPRPSEEDIPGEPQDNQELQSLREELEQARRQLKKAQESRPEPIAPVKTELVYVADPQVDQLKARVKELKELVRERNEERAGLRRSLKQHVPRTESTEPNLFTPQQDDEAPEAECERYRPLEPVFSKAAQQQLRELPTATARLGLRLLGELAAGAGPAWGKCQRLQQTDDVYSTRLGREYRLLFRVEEKVGELRIEQMVHRSELERTLKGSKL